MSVRRRPPGFNIDLAFADSKEAMSIPARYRNAAIGLWVRCGAWSANKLTDGFVPGEVVRAFGGTSALVSALVDSTLIVRPEVRADKGAIQLTNWERWQRTRAEVKAYRASEAKRKEDERARKKASTNSGDADMSDRTNDGHDDAVRVEHRAPKTREGSLVVTSERESPVGSCPPTPLEEFPDHCVNHRHDPDPPKCFPCKRTREANEDQSRSDADAAAVAAANDRARELARREACPECRGGGWLLDIWGEPTDPAIRCQHPGVS